MSEISPRQFVVENSVLMLAAAVLGVILASVALRVLLIAAPPDTPRLSDVVIDARVLAVVIAISLAIGFVFGLVPLLQSRRGDLQSALKSDVTRGATGSRESVSARSALMVGEIALAVVLLSGAGLLIKSFWYLQRVNPGFDADGVVKAEFQLPSSRYPMNKDMQQFNARLLARALALPGVQAAAIAGNHPLDPGFTNSFEVVGRAFSKLTVDA